MRRVLGFGHVVALGVNSVIGAGIFIVPGPLAKLGLASVGVFLLAGILLFPIALSFAHLGRLTDRSGGAYIYAQTAFGPFVGFGVGWITWLTSVFSASTIGSALAIYLGYFNVELTHYSTEIAVLSIVFFGVLNYVGVRAGGGATELLTVLKTIPLIVLGIWGLFYVGPKDFAVPSTVTMSSLGLPFLMTLFTCCGFEVVPYIAGETKTPQNFVPKAILLSLWVPIALYCVIQLSVLASGSTSDAALTDLAGFLWGKNGARIVNATGLISVLGFLAGTLLGAPRLLMVLSEDRHLPRALLAVHPKFQTPHTAIAATTFTSILFAFVGDLGALISLTSLVVLLQYLASTMALLRLSWRGQTSGFVPALLGTLITLACLFQIELMSWILLAAASLIGLVARSAFRRHLLTESRPAI